MDIESLCNKIMVLETKLQRLDKVVRKMKRDMVPESERKPRQPSGFAKPTYLSNELCTFLEIPEGSEIPRTEVTRRLLNYVKDKKLQNPDAKREILLDDKLKTLLKPNDDEVVTYFNIQRLLKIHYVKPADNVKTDVSTPVEKVSTKKPKASKKK